MIKKNCLLLLSGLIISLSAMDAPVVSQQITLKQVFSNEDNDRVHSFNINPQGTRLAVACGKEVQVHEVLPDASISKKYVPISYERCVRAVCFDCTGNYLMACDAGSSIDIYSLPAHFDDRSSVIDIYSLPAHFDHRSSVQKIDSYRIKGDMILLVASHQEKPLSACYDEESCLQTFDIENNAIKNIKKYHVAGLSGIFFDTKENYLVMSCFRSELQTLDCTNEKFRSLLCSLSRFDPVNNCAAFAGIDEGAIWICKMKALISLVDTKKIDGRSSAVQQHEEIRRLEEAFPLQYDPTFGSPEVISFDAQGKYLVVGWRNKEKILVYNLESKSIVSQYWTAGAPIGLISNFPKNNKMMVSMGSAWYYIKKDMFTFDLS